VNERIAVALVVLAACGDRVVEAQFHAPEHCPGEVAAECPMAALGSLLVEVERTSGEIVGRRCTTPTTICDYEDLLGTSLLDDLPPLAGLEVRVEGFQNDVCLGAADVFCCDSAGEHLVDLGSEAFPVDLWCSCAPRGSPCPP
jgi:hypothetical protein